ncbi:four-jointed box protein 1 [Octopus sinensis]|uniref:Four-jointed box protein 1 n=2 Tax=Octopus TaxID=6643 RepID=A0A6P7SK21_9MOLL|nr:four-jointed box protein 1 [Octopus sinensis]XP_036360704.1 four-jointed box protein 1 [Octopus sinensis]
MLTYKFRISKTVLFFLVIFSIFFFFVNNVLLSEPNMQALDYITDRRQINAKQAANAKSHRELSSYDSQARVQWLERKPKAHIITADDKKLVKIHGLKTADKNLRFKKTLNKTYKDNFNKNESEESEMSEYSVNMESTLEDDVDYNNDVYTEDNYYNNVAENTIVKEKEIDKIGTIGLNKPLLKFKSFETLPKNSTSKQLKVSDVDKENGKELVKSFQKISSPSPQDLPISNGIFWSSAIENLVPKGSPSRKLEKELQKIKTTPVRVLQPPTWNKCGRPKNGLVLLEDNTYLCARYRDPHNKLVLGEVLSFYLSRLLGLDNVPIVSLSKVNHSSVQWKGINFSKLQWTEGNLVALIQWIPGISTVRSHVQMPEIIYKAYLQGKPLTGSQLQQAKLNKTTLSDIVQWGSMIIFDFLTANYDRVASMQDAALKEKRPSILQEHIRNLRKSPTSGKFWLIDNESGLLDAYDLLYRDKISGKNFVSFHQQMLKTMCIFQKSVADSLQTLKSLSAPHLKLEDFARYHEPLLNKIPKDYTYSLFKSMFSKRLAEVSNWIEYCKTR